MSFARAAAQSALALGAVCRALAHAAITAESAYPSKVIRIVEWPCLRCSRDCR